MSRFVKTVSVLIALTFVSGCAKRTDAGNIIDVKATDESCEVSLDTAAAGALTFKVTNAGEQVTEFYVLGSDGQAVVSEAENIGPGLSRDLVVSLSAGDYFLVCIPGMKGDGFKTSLTIAGSDNGATAGDPRIEQAVDQYKSFVLDQSALLLEQTKVFAQAYVAGDFETARSLYAPTRMHWERIEPVAESFGDLDPLLDLREADVEPGTEWTGWHKIEKDLWPPADGYTALSDLQRKTVSDLLVTHTNDLNTCLQDMEFPAFQMGNGAKELLDEVATGKVTGEEEIWSGTDLWDFVANVEGAQKVFTLLEPVVIERDPELAATLEDKFTRIFALLELQKSGEGYKLYPELTNTQVRELADAVNAPAEPLSRLTSVVVN